MTENWNVGDWAWSLEHDGACRLIEVDKLWGQDTALAWIPQHDATVRMSKASLAPLDQNATGSANGIAYVSAAARIADALERDVLVAPLEGTVIPLPHQLSALSRAMSGDRVRYLLADEVGLGKTIEAGLILRELKIRGLVKRILVIAPTGLVTQWVSEMETHFNEIFKMVIPSEFSALRKLSGVDDNENLWRIHDQVVCPIDSVKPLDTRKGWSHDQIARYNRERFEDLVTAGWDLIIIDESHRLGGSTEQVARYRLGEALSQSAPYLLLLSATPHQGKTDAFRRLLSFLDQDAFPDDESVSQENVSPYVIRTEKRNTIDADGQPLFKPRHTKLVTVPWSIGHEDQKVLYESVTEYVRDGYNQARREKNTAIGFLMILFQRLVTSSVCAIRTALEKRMEVLELPSGQLSLFGEDVGEEWAHLDSQAQMETALSSRMKGLENERSEVELLLSAARQCEAKGPDVKAQALLDWIQKLQREENDPELKVLVFTEFVPTQRMLAEFLGNRGFSVVCLNGSLGMDERREVQRAFSDEAQVLISTDAGGEGLNLQFCHVIFNYDLPWNPMKLEQRIGRVDRIGQTHIVRAQNFALADTVELRVREVLEEKLKRILEDFGVDKLADVLDSEDGGVDFDDLYFSAVLTPEEAEARASQLADRVRERASASTSGAKVLGNTEFLDPALARKIADHQLPYWTERMTLSYLGMMESRGAQVKQDDIGYRLIWPDGNETRRSVFTRCQAEEPGSTLLSLESPNIRGLTSRLHAFAPGQPIHTVILDGISEHVSGVWSLWRISIQSADERIHRILPLFQDNNGRVLLPTARAVWDRLLDLDSLPEDMQIVTGKDAEVVYGQTLKAAQEHGRFLYDELMNAHRERLERQVRNGRRSFESRRKSIELIGLPAVRTHRLRNLDRDESQWKEKVTAREQTIPELNALLVLRVGAKVDA